jgi:hypothetical protein
MRGWSGWPPLPGRLAAGGRPSPPRATPGTAGIRPRSSTTPTGSSPARERGRCSVTQHAVHQLSGSDSGYYLPLSWPCPGCGEQVTDRAAYGRPVHVEHGHAPGCARLARDQAADDQRRWDRLPGQIVQSEDPVGPVQRHWLAERITDDCPRCGWHGYFHHYITTVDRDWAAAVCDNCYADLHPGITVTLRFYAARWPDDGRPVAVIRQRTRSDHDYPDIGHFPDRGRAITWQLWWQHTPMLVDDQRGNCIEDITEISRLEAEQITAGLAARYFPPDAAGCRGSCRSTRSSS